MFAHQPLRFRNPPTSLIVGDRYNSRNHSLQPLDLLRQILSLLDRVGFLGVGESKAPAEESRAGKSGGGAKKISSIGAHGAPIVIEA